MRHHEHGGGMDQINLDVPHIGQISALTLIAFTVGLVLMPFRYLRAQMRVFLVAIVFLPVYAIIVASLGESNLFDHPLLCVPLLIAGMWVSDEMRRTDDARKAKKMAAHQAHIEQKLAARRARASQQRGIRK